MGQGKIAEGWKNIAFTLGVSERQAQRYAKKNGLPVRCLGDFRNARVVAAIDQLEAWMRKRKQSKPLHGDDGS